MQVGQLQKNLQQKIPCLVEVKLEFPERLGGDIAKIRWITLHYGTGDSEDDGEYYNKLEKYDFFPEHGTELETYQFFILCHRSDSRRSYGRQKRVLLTRYL